MILVNQKLHTATERLTKSARLLVKASLAIVESEHESEAGGRTSSVGTLKDLNSCSDAIPAL